MPMKLSEMTPGMMPLVKEVRGETMETTNSAKLEFYRSYNKTQGALAPVKADSVNDHFHSKYASLQAVMEAVAPFFEAGFSIHHTAFFQDGRSFLRTSLVLGDYGIDSVLPLVDDGNPQHLASSQTYAKRGNILNLTAIPLDVDDDGNAATDGSTKTVTREPAQFAAKKAAEKAAVTPGELEVVRFVPSKVVFVEGKGKGAGKTFSEIYDGNTKYGGNEMQGQLAESAASTGKTIAVCFKRNGNYLNIGSNGVKLVDKTEDIIEEIGF